MSREMFRSRGTYKSHLDNFKVLFQLNIFARVYWTLAITCFCSACHAMQVTWQGSRDDIQSQVEKVQCTIKELKYYSCIKIKQHAYLIDYKIELILNQSTPSRLSSFARSCWPCCPIKPSLRTPITHCFSFWNKKHGFKRIHDSEGGGGCDSMI